MALDMEAPFETIVCKTIACDVKKVFEIETVSIARAVSRDALERVASMPTRRVRVGASITP
jgi:ribosomal protein L31E